jgi:hypothetical protein
MSVLSFLAGGVIGVLVYQAVGGLLLLGAAVLLFMIAISGIRGARILRTSSAAVE